MSAASSTSQEMGQNKLGNNLASADADKGDIMNQRRSGQPLVETSKADLIAERQSNLPRPEDPPVASDWNSMDSRNVNVGSGRLQDNTNVSGQGSETGLREPATVSSETDMSSIGRQGVEGLPDPPKDARSSGNTGN